jgi:hypothetical protein
MHSRVPQELISNFVKLFPLLKAAGLADVTGHKTAPGRPKALQQNATLAVHLEGVAPLDSEWDTSMVASSLWSHEDGRSHGETQHAEPEHEPTPVPVSPVHSRPVHTRAGPAVRLHRPCEAIRKSGLPSATGVVNIAIPSEFVQEMRQRRLTSEPRAASVEVGVVVVLSV